MMKSRYSPVLLALGCILFPAGAAFKISHWPHADEILIAAIGFEAAGLTLLVIRVVAKSKTHK